MTPRVLIVDDDRDIRTFVQVSLALAGFDTIEAEDGLQAIDHAVNESPDIVVMDVMMPKLDGFTALRRMREDGRISHIPIILLTAKTQTTDKLAGFEAGADDYLTKPFDPPELVARIQATLRRAADMRAIQPLTGLPGNASIERELARRAAGDEPFALMHCDLNNFKAYNDHYGFSRGDDVIRTFAELVVSIARDLGGPETFVGHVGGDDFVVLTAGDLWEPMARRICTDFDAAVPALYDATAAAAGHIVVPDRQSNERTYPLVAVSIGVAPSPARGFSHPEEAVTVANEMKTFAKVQAMDGGSNYAVDRRVGPS